MTPTEAYAKLTDRMKQTSLLDTAGSVLSWDQETYMPPGGVEHRGNQLAVLAGLSHEQRTEPVVGEWIAKCEGSELTADPLSPTAINIRELRRDYDRATKLPKTLVEELARVASVAQHHWAEARKSSDYAQFAPYLEQTIKLKRQQAEAYGYEDHLYDALLDDYEPGAKTKDLTTLFAALRDELTPLVASIVQAPRQPNVKLLQRKYPIDRQRLLGEWAAAKIGFNFQHGRLDVTNHPFCTTIGPGDVRITTRYDEHDFGDAFFSILHESGHAMYEQGLPTDQFGLPMGSAVSLGVHESQSRMWENDVGRSLAFWRHFFPQAQQIFRESLHDVAAEEFHFALNHVAPSFIRVDADQVTYNLHVIVRFEMEQALLSDQLPIADVPTAWNEKYQKYLGITPLTAAQGCLQDIHWSAGLVGYFPTYTLGNLLGAQLFAAASKALGDLPNQLAHGEFSTLLDWLRQNVHQHGRRYRLNDLAQHTTGASLSIRPFVDSLKRRMTELYHL